MFEDPRELLKDELGIFEILASAVKVTFNSDGDLLW